MVTDPIADYLTRIRNAQMANHRIVEIPASNLKKRITEILYDKGYILKYKFEDDAKQGVIKIALKYDVNTKLPAGFIPLEDQGMIYGIIQTPPGSTIEYTNAKSHELQTIAKSIDGVNSVSSAEAPPCAASTSAVVTPVKAPLSSTALAPSHSPARDMCS